MSILDEKYSETVDKNHVNLNFEILQKEGWRFAEYRHSVNMMIDHIIDGTRITDEKYTKEHNVSPYWMYYRSKNGYLSSIKVSYDKCMDRGETRILHTRFQIKLKFFRQPSDWEDNQYADIQTWQDLLNWMHFIENYTTTLNEFNELRKAAGPCMIV